MGLESPEAAAAGIVDIVNENMLGGLRLVSVQQGFDPRDFALVAFGGAGPLHANALGRLTGAWPVIVPPSPGVLCALGDATTSRRDESARTVLRRFADLSGADLVTILRELADDAGQRLADQGLPRERADGRRTRSTSGTTGRASRSRSSSTRLARRPGRRLRAAGGDLRRRAQPAVLLPARRRPRAGQRPRDRHRPEARRHAGAPRAGRRRPEGGAARRAPDPRRRRAR